MLKKNDENNKKSDDLSGASLELPAGNGNHSSN